MTAVITFECKFCRERVAEWNMLEHMKRFHATAFSSLKGALVFSSTEVGTRMAASYREAKIQKIQKLSPSERVSIARKEQDQRRRIQAEANRMTNSAITKREGGESESFIIANAWQKNKDVLMQARNNARKYHIHLAELQRMENQRRAEATKRAVVSLKRSKSSASGNVAQPQIYPVVAKFKKQAFPESGYIPPATVDCSCGGNNENCFRCSGTGYYVSKHVKAENILPKKRTSQEVTFASDNRGGEYSIREKGRFSSNPLYDDYGDESGAG